MAEPYYRISTAQSELDNILYDQGNLTGRLNGEAKMAKEQGEDDIPKVTRIKATHRFPFRSQFRPTVIMANQILVHTNSSNNRFTLEYGGEFIARMYQALDISAGTLAFPVGSTLGPASGWAYCPNFIAALLTLASFKVSTDTLYEFTGEMLYVFYSIISPIAQHTALARMLHETTYEMKWVPGGAANSLPYGVAAEASAFDNVMMVHPDTPAQAYALTHPAMTIYIPYNLFTMNNVEDAYPEVAVYSLQRTLEYTFKSILSVINLWAIDTLVPPVSGFIEPTFAGTVGYTWSAVPAITATRIYVEHITLHRDMQQMMAMNAHAFMIRQYYKDTETMDTKVLHEIAVTKVIESLYLIGNFNRNSITRTAVDAGVTSVQLSAAPVTTPVIYPIDPFYVPVNTKPIDNITLSARGQQFYRDVKWDEFGSVWPYLFGKCDNNTSANACLAVITFGLWYRQQDHTGTYNSGWGPNLRIAWTAQAFSSLNPGTLIILLQCINMVLAYRGALTVRYT